MQFTFEGEAPQRGQFLRANSLQLYRQGINPYWSNEYHPRRETPLFKANIGKHTTAVYAPKQENGKWSVRITSTLLEQLTPAQRTKFEAVLQKLKK